MRILITGGTGFLGMHLGRGLVEQGHEVTLYDVSAHESFVPTSSFLRANVVNGDITDSKTFKYALESNQIEAVVHLAAMLTGPCQADPIEGTRINCLGSAVVFQNSIDTGVNRVVYGSSVAVFSPVSIPPADDTLPTMPPSVYGATKVYTENLAEVLERITDRTKFTGIRFGWVYGAGRKRGWNIIQDVIEGFALERDEVAYPDYSEPNDWTYVDDAVGAIIACLEADHLSQPVYNLSGDYRTIQEAVALLKSRYPSVRAVPYAAGLPPSAWNFTSTWLDRDTGFRAGINLEEGLERTASELRLAAGKID
jgi:UDP-glucose 4-epimerase